MMMFYNYQLFIYLAIILSQFSYFDLEIIRNNTTDIFTKEMKDVAHFLELRGAIKKRWPKPDPN